MPTLVNPWGRFAAASDAQVKAYRGLTQNHLAELVRSGVDITAYSEAKRVHHRLNVDSAAEACERADASYIREKRVLLHAMSGLVDARTLEAVGTCHVEATQHTKGVGADLLLVEEARGRVLVQLGSFFVLVEEEGDGEGREDGRVDDEQQDDPVPDGLEGRVVEDDELLLEFLDHAFCGASVGLVAG